MTNKDEIYHFGIPGMRWGRRKAKEQTSQNGGRSAGQSKKQTKQSKTQTDQSKQSNNQDTQQESQSKSSAVKKGLIAAGVALAVIGGIVIARKLSKSTNVSVDTTKKIDTGKAKVDKVKNTKVSSLKAPKTPKRRAERITTNKPVAKPVDTLTRHANAWNIISRLRL